jgi:uncharacterized protein YutE (UPF0331/DUF86 family)
MDKSLIYEKIESLRRCVARVESRRPEQLDLLLTDFDIQDILSLNLTRAVQLCVDIAMHLIASSSQPIPETMAASFDRLHDMRVLPADLSDRLKSAVGFRNVAIHNYRRLDWGIVFTISHERLDDFRQFAAAVTDYLDGD